MNPQRRKLTEAHAANVVQNSSNFIAVFDSGVGGLSVLSALQTALPDETFRYFADTEHAPYGEKSAATVRKLVEKQVDSFIRDGAKAVVLACNTATSVAAATLRENYPDISIIGMEPALKPAVESKECPKVLILATPLTIQEQKFQQLAQRYQDSAEIISVPCAGLAEAVEQAFATAGYQGSTPSTTDLAQILDRIQSNSAIYNLLQKLIGAYTGKVDAVVLGCTHYVHLKPLIAAILGENVAIFDGVDGTVREVIRRLAK